MYHHKTKTGFFCIRCAAAKDQESLMQELPNGWRCSIDPTHFVDNGKIPPTPLPPSEPSFFG